MSIDVDERISSHITNECECECESGARPGLGPWNAASAKERITHPLAQDRQADVKG